MAESRDRYSCRRIGPRRGSTPLVPSPCVRPDMAEANRLRWDWQYRRNPNVPADGPLIWIAREGTTIVGQYATMPVRLVGQRAARSTRSWGMDVMVAPERQRQGLGDVLFRTWDRNVGASLGLGLSESSYRLFQKLRWPDVGPVPCLVKPLSRRALRRPDLAGGAQPAGRRLRDAALDPARGAHAAAPGRSAGDPPLRRAASPRLWDRIGAAVRASPSGVMRRT